MNTNNQYKKLTESLKLLSLEFEEQVQCFPEFVEVPFEVLDTFDNAFLLLPKLIDDRKVNYDVVSSLLRLHNLINFTSSNPNFKDLEIEKFSDSDEWNKVRSLSREILQLMGEQMGKPNLEYI